MAISTKGSTLMGSLTASASTSGLAAVSTEASFAVAYGTVTASGKE